MTADGAEVLYIDDDDALRRLVQKALTRRGYRVTTAADGKEGAAMAAARAFDIISIDHFMPGQDGLTTLAHLRNLPDPPPLIYVTGSDESRLAVAALKAGADDYVVKTVGEAFFDLLDSTFRQALDQVRLRRDKAAAEEALLAANARLETVVQRQAALLREVNHRVANSLQLVIALVRMQAATVQEASARTALIDAQARIEAISQVHRKLYTSDDVEAVDMAEYLAALLSELEQAWSTAGARRSLVLDAEPVRLHPDKAVSLGVIVSELVANACKYAYAPDSHGEVRIGMRTAAGDLVELVVEDDGPGFRDGDPPRGTGLGQKVIGAMAASLRSAVGFDPAYGGVRAVMRFRA